MLFFPEETLTSKINHLTDISQLLMLLLFQETEHHEGDASCSTRRI